MTGRQLMTDILIRDIDNELDKALKIMAIEHGRTREAEIKSILKSAISTLPERRSLADVLMEIPRLNTDSDELFKRPAGYSRNMDQS